MLETIIKRDGSRQPYEASKLNKWFLWAARNVRSRVDWSSIVMKTVKSLGKEVESKTLNELLIRNLVRAKRWPEQIMAGNLYASDSRKEIFGAAMPTIRKLHHRLADLGLMDRMKYTDEDYMFVERMIDHERDFNMAYFQVKQLRKKYAIKNEVKNIEYETPQYIFMRMAMALAENASPVVRMGMIQSLYDDFSLMRVNAPTPNYVNLGTQLKGFASCCLYAVGDNIPSLAAGDYIGYRMTAISAGIGNIIMSRSVGDPIRGGKIKHAGKYPYWRAQAGAVTANKQAGRSGADNTYLSIYDPEIQLGLMLQNPRTATDKRNRDIHLTIEHNKLVTKKMALNEDMFLFNSYTAPDLYEAQFSGDFAAFEELYAKYEADPNFAKTYVAARDVIRTMRQQRNEVATLYTLQIDEVNRHTPHKDPIRSSNLCVEITQPTEPYDSVVDLHKEYDLSYAKFKDASGNEVVLKGESFYELIDAEGTKYEERGCYIKAGETVILKNAAGINEWIDLAEFVEYKRNPEVSTCSLGGIVISNIPEGPEGDLIYEQSAYNTLVMIDECIFKSDFPLEHVKWTSHQRLNAGVGILGLAHHMARKNLKYNTPEGLAEIDRVMERHAYFVIKASLKLGKERGNAPWMHRTKWPEGWLPIDTYKKTVDELVPFELRYDWETLRAEIIENKGIRNSSLIALMPTESSSKASGAPNGPYQVRDLDLKKSDSSNLLEWCAPDNDLLADQYQLAWETTPIEQIKYYAVMQKWTDQSISADIYRDRTKKIINEKGQEVLAPISDDELFQEQHAIVYYGVKSEYYMNSFTGGKQHDDEGREVPQAVQETENEELEAEFAIAGPGCDGGACTL